MNNQQTPQSMSEEGLSSDQSGQSACAADSLKTAPVTEEDLANLTKLLAEATPGPWAIDNDFLVTTEAVELEYERKAISDLRFWHMPKNDANAALVVAAVNALPRILAALRDVGPLGPHTPVARDYSDKEALRPSLDEGVRERLSIALASVDALEGRGVMVHTEDLRALLAQGGGE